MDFEQSLKTSCFQGLFKIDYNVSVLDDLKPTNKLYQDIKTVEGNMGGVFPVEILVEYNYPILQESFNDKEVRKQLKKDLNDINNFKEDITKIEEISSVSAFTDLLPRLVDAYPGNQNLNIADNPKFNSKHIDKYVDHC